MSIFLTFCTSCFYSLERSFFVLKYRKRHFPGLICPKQNVGRMAIFGPKAWINPFGKMSIFRLLNLLFYSLDTRFFCSRISYKTFLWTILPQKKKMEKWPFFNQNYGLTPLENVNFSTFSTSCFL